MDRADDRESGSSRRERRRALTAAGPRGETTGRAGERAPSRVGATRRRVLAASGGAVAGGSALANVASAQADETTTDGEPTDDPEDEDAENRITTTMAIEDVPGFDGPYGSQFLVIQSTEYSPERTPGLEDCSGVEWTLQNTKSYDGAIIDRISEDPKGFQTTVHIADEDRDFRPGQTFIISDVTECGDYVALGVEGVGPVSLAGKEPVDTVGGDGGDDGAGSTPGFSAGGAVAGLAALVGLGAVRRATDE